jgi:uroporphyrinogen-III decarboxylase
MAKKDLENSPYDRSQTLLTFGMHVGYFQLLASFMGFADGMCAMYEEPDEVKALVEYLSDFYMEVARKSIDYYKPDLLGITDDIATVANPFFSLEMYREIFKPAYQQMADLAMDRGIPCEMHCCGHCDIFIDDWVNDLNVRSWNPAQTSNDILAIKEKYRGRLVICGAYDYSKQPQEYNTEEKIKQSVYETLDKYAPGGGYAFAGNFLGPYGDAETKQKNRWVAEAVYSYGRSFYKTH